MISLYLERPLSKANSKHISPREKNITDAAYLASALDQVFIEKMKSDPYQWNKFLQKGRALYALSKALNDIGTS